MESKELVYYRKIKPMVEREKGEERKREREGERGGGRTSIFSSSFR